MTRYLFEGDVDLMIILHFQDNQEYADSEGAEKMLNKFKRILDDNYPDTEKRRDRNCITMQFSEFRLDVVPAFKFDTGDYIIPDSVEEKWLSTNPIEFAKKITEVNKKMDSDFVPLIKMIKAWNRQVGWPIGSFHLECIMYNRYCTYQQSYTFDSMIRYFFESLPLYLSTTCYDPVTGERVDKYLDTGGSTTLREIAIKKAKKAAEKSQEAFEYQIKYPSIAIGEWKALLGDFFPVYG